MKNISFSLLDKSKKGEYAEPLFRILYDNMKDIIPDFGSINQEFCVWSRAVLPALEKEQRKIILVRSCDELCGFLQYYTTVDTIVVEELQLAKSIQRTRALSLLLKFASDMLPKNIEYIEAYARIENGTSVSLMERSGMRKDKMSDGKFYHFRGALNPIIKRKSIS